MDKTWVAIRKYLSLLLLVFYTLHLDTLHVGASCPSCIEEPQICWVIGQVAEIQDQSSFAVIQLKEALSSRTYAGCPFTVDDAVNVSLNIEPKPHIILNDKVVIELGPGASAKMAKPRTLEELLSEAEMLFGYRLHEQEYLYHIKSYLGVASTLERLETMVKTEHHKGAAFLLIMLAKEKYPVSPAILNEAFILAMTKSHKCFDVAREVTNATNQTGLIAQLIEILNTPHEKGIRSKTLNEDYCVFGIIQALGELGPSAKIAISSIMNWTDEPYDNDGGGMAAKMAKVLQRIQGEKEAIELLLLKIKSGQVLYAGYPLVRGICDLAAMSTIEQAEELHLWCLQHSE